jgi:hypothetical protein
MVHGASAGRVTAEQKIIRKSAEENLKEVLRSRGTRMSALEYRYELYVVLGTIYISHSMSSKIIMTSFKDY